MHAVDNENKKSQPSHGALGLDAVRRLNCRQMAEALDVAYGDVLDARRAGLPMPGNRTTVAAYNAWIEEHPNYREEARRLRATAPWKGRG